MNYQSAFAGVFQNLIGEWHLDRAISPGAKLTGRASFQAISDNIMRVSEEGELQLPDGSLLSAARSWQWQLSGDCGLRIFFDETPLRLYHELVFVFENDTWMGQDIHHCEPDIYHGEYRILQNSIETLQTVSGPKKDYQISSCFNRLAGHS